MVIISFDPEVMEAVIEANKEAKNLHYSAHFGT